MDVTKWLGHLGNPGLDMLARPSIVIDTNVWLSSILWPNPTLVGDPWKAKISRPNVAERAAACR